MDGLIVTEIYKSIQGESSWAGIPCTFIRLTGCPLRCRWCDTVYSFKGGRVATIEQILAEVEQLQVNLVELTGGEPLAQKGAIGLMEKLLQHGYQVLLETSGAFSLAAVPKAVHVIMDLKCPDSRMDKHNDWGNLAYLKSLDEIKFVVASKEDFDWACAQVREHQLDKICRLLFSPAWGLVPPKDLVSWLLASGIEGRINLQLHKYIWGPRVKGV